jgi:hypothetical protein
MSRIEPGPAGAVDATTLGTAAVQSSPAGTHVVGGERPVQKGFDPDPPQTTEPAGEQPVEGAAPSSPEGSQQGEAQLDPQAQVMQEMLRKIQEMDQRQSQVDKDKAITPDQVAEAATFETQRMQLEQQKMETMGGIEAQLAEVQKQMEEGDVDVTKGVQQMTALQRQLLQAENQFDKQISSIDLRLEQQQMQAESQVRQAREQFLQNEQGFGEFYQSTYNQKYKNDPVYGDPVAAYYKERFDASEAEKAQLQQQLQQQSATVASAKPGTVSNVASSGVATTGQQKQDLSRLSPQERVLARLAPNYKDGQWVGSA